MTPSEHYAKAQDLCDQIYKPPRLVGDGWREKLIAEATMHYTAACVPGHVEARVSLHHHRLTEPEVFDD